MPLTLNYAVFCEDVRMEVAGTATLVGVLGNQFNVPTFPVTLRTLAFFASIENPTQEGNTFRVSIFVPNQAPAAFSDELVTEANKSTNFMSIRMGPFQLAEPGEITVDLTVNSIPPFHVVKSLRFVQGPIGHTPMPSSARPVPIGR